MISVTVSLQQVRSAPPTVRQWIENQVAATLRSPIGARYQLPPAHSTAPVTSTREEMLQVSALIYDDFAASLDEMICWWRNQRIRERAYEIWEQAGRPEGRAVEHWLQAEAEMRRKLLREDLSRPRPPRDVARRIEAATVPIG